MTNSAKVPPKEEVQVLRGRDELEKQLATQIALGVIDSLEAAEERGNLDALEYSAQMLFDNVRERVAERTDLPLHIVMYLVKDRKESIRFRVIRNNYNILPEATKEAFFNEAAQIYHTIKKGKYYDSDSKKGMCRETVSAIMRTVFNNRQDELMVRLLDIIKYDLTERGIHSAIDKRFHLREMPLTCVRVYDPNTKAIDTISIVHPDVKIRTDAVTKLLPMKVKDLRCHFPEEESRAEYVDTNIKTEVYGIVAKDPEVKIRRMLLDGMNHEPTLSWMADNDESALLRRKAKMKANRAKKRSEYHATYHENKR